MIDAGRFRCHRRVVWCHTGDELVDEWVNHLPNRHRITAKTPTAADRGVIRLMWALKGTIIAISPLIALL